MYLSFCVPADGLCGSQFSPTTTQVLGISLGSPGLEARAKPAQPSLSPLLSPLSFTAFSSVGSGFTSPSSLCFFNANKFSSFFFLLMSQSFGINLSFKQMLFSYLFLCLTQVLAYGDKFIQLIILLPQLPKCISLSCR